jgi:hypothetical protein
MLMMSWFSEEFRLFFVTPASYPRITYQGNLGELGDPAGKLYSGFPAARICLGGGAVTNEIKTAWADGCHPLARIFFVAK